MDVKQAVNIAAEYVAEMEQLTRLKDARNKGDDLQFLKQLHFSIEGTKFNDRDKTWVIEVGFTRPWDKAPSNPLLGGSVPGQDHRTIKRVTISDDDGKVIRYGK